MEPFVNQAKMAYLLVAEHPTIGATAFIAVHSISRGPAVGGTRVRRFETTEAAVEEINGLAHAMSRKAAMAGLEHGGGKALIVPPADFNPQNYNDPRRPELFEWFGGLVESLGGAYVTTEDSGTSMADMNHIRRSTNYVLGQPPEFGGSGDPSPKTARGVRYGIEAINENLIQKDPADLIVNVQGVGHVGAHTVRELVDYGVGHIRIADSDAVKCDLIKAEFPDRNIETVDKNAILKTPADIFCPCAFGGVLAEAFAADCDFRAIAGAANNQFANPNVANILNSRGIFVATDYVVNAGGLISVCSEYSGVSESEMWSQVKQIKLSIANLIDRSKKTGLPPSVIADHDADELIDLGPYSTKDGHRWRKGPKRSGSILF